MNGNDETDTVDQILENVREPEDPEDPDWMEPGPDCPLCAIDGVEGPDDERDLDEDEARCVDPGCPVRTFDPDMEMGDWGDQVWGRLREDLRE